MEALRDALSSIPTILTAMAGLAVLEAAIPLCPLGPWSRRHRAPNLALGFLTLATNALLGAGLALTLAAARARGLGLLNAVAPPAGVSTVVVALGLDLAFYVSHVAMHASPVLWRFHRVHHSDPTVDVTTTLRQHPVESLIRYCFTAAFALPLGASPTAFAIYRGASVLSGLLEHANLRVPRALEAWLSLVFTWPTLHKVHHSRDARLTDRNYGNLVAWWDRLFATFTPAAEGYAVSYGLDDLDDPATQTVEGLLTLPFRPLAREHDAGGTAGTPGRALVRAGWARGEPEPDGRLRSGRRSGAPSARRSVRPSP